MASKEDKAVKAEASTRSGSADKNGGSEQQQLEELYKLMQSEGLDSLELKDDDTTIRLIRHHAASPVFSFPVQGAHAAPAAAVPAPAAPAAEASGNTINTPLAGVFYRASSPTTPAFAKEGDVVSAGQTLCIVEAMKVMNEIKAEAPCKIVKILAENSRPVTAGQPLFQVESA